MLALLARAALRRRQSGKPGAWDLLSGRHSPEELARRAGLTRERVDTAGRVVVRLVSWAAVLALAGAVIFLALVLYAVLGA